MRPELVQHFLQLAQRPHLKVLTLNCGAIYNCHCLERGLANTTLHTAGGAYRCASQIVVKFTLAMFAQGWTAGDTAGLPTGQLSDTTDEASFYVAPSMRRCHLLFSRF